MHMCNKLDYYKACLCVYDEDKPSLSRCTVCCSEIYLMVLVVLLYIESLIYFIITNIYDYEYCYALYGLRLITVLSCIIATLYIYSAYNDHMFDWVSGF